MNWNIRRSARLATAVALAGALGVAGLAVGASASTKPKPKPKPKPSVTLTVEKPAAANLSETGSTLLYPLWNIWAPGYQSAYRNVTISTAGTGSGTGIADAASGTVNIGSSDAYLSPTTLAASPTLLNIPLAPSSSNINSQASTLLTNSPAGWYRYLAVLRELGRTGLRGWLAYGPQYHRPSNLSG